MRVVATYYLKVVTAFCTRHFKSGTILFSPGNQSAAGGRPLRAIASCTSRRSHAAFAIHLVLFAYATVAASPPVGYRDNRLALLGRSVADADLGGY